MANELVKKPYIKQYLTHEQTQEWLKCSNDLEYFVRNYVKVQHPSRGAIYFEPYEYQSRVFKEFKEHDHVICLFPRQSGKTASVTSYMLWKAVFRKDFKMGVAAHKGSGAKEVIARFKYAYEYLPMWMKPGVVAYNVFDVAFDNGSSIISQTTTETTFRGLSMSLLYLDEFAFVKPRIAEEFWASLLPSISAGTDEDMLDADGNPVEPVQLIITSTPNGSEGMFARLWFKSQRDPDDSMLYGFEVKNEEVPGRDENFKRTMLKSMTPLKYAQEFLCQFVSSKSQLIKSDILERIKGEEPVGDVYGVRLYDDVPFRGRRIGMAIDVAEGIGGDSDYSTIELFDIDTLEQIGEFDDNEMNISDFTKHIISVMTYIKRAGAKELYYSIESNPIGLSVINLLRNSTATILDWAEMVTDNSRRGGILTTNKSKLAGCALLKDLVENDKMKLKSKKLLSELKFFVKKGASFGAESGMHDDLVMGTVVFCSMLKIMSNSDEQVDEKINKIYDAECVTEYESSPLPLVF